MLAVVIKGHHSWEGILQVYTVPSGFTKASPQGGGFQSSSSSELLSLVSRVYAIFSNRVSPSAARGTRMSAVAWDVSIYCLRATTKIKQTKSTVDTVKVQYMCLFKWGTKSVQIMPTEAGKENREVMTCWQMTESPRKQITKQ